MAKILDLDLDLCEGSVSEPTDFIHVYHYPCSSKFGSGEDSPGMVAHTDRSVVAILLQNDVSGLEVQKDGRWILVNPIPGGLVVNLGDTMQALSKYGYKSVRTPSEQSDRISICYLVFPRVPSTGSFRYDVKTVGVKVGRPRQVQA